MVLFLKYYYWIWIEMTNHFSIPTCRKYRKPVSWDRKCVNNAARTHMNKCSAQPSLRKEKVELEQARYAFLCKPVRTRGEKKQHRTSLYCILCFAVCNQKLTSRLVLRWQPHLQCIDTIRTLSYSRKHNKYTEKNVSILTQVVYYAIHCC